MSNYPQKSPTDWVGNIIIGACALFLVGVLGALVITAFLNYKDAHSPNKTKTCTVVEKYTTSYKGHLSDRALRTKQCGKFSVGKRVKVWDKIKEGKTYKFTYHGGNTGLRDLTKVEEVK